MDTSADRDETLDVEALVGRIQSGDEAGFDQLVIHFQPMVTGLLYRFSSRQADLEDLVQETYIKIWRGIPNWQPDKPFEHWLKRVTVNAGLEYCRRQKRSPVDLSRTVSGESELPDGSDDKSLGKIDYQESLEEAQYILSILPTDDQALLTLLYLEEMPLVEIAEHFDWSHANTKIKAYRARKRLKKTLIQHGYQFKK